MFASTVVRRERDELETANLERPRHERDEARPFARTAAGGLTEKSASHHSSENVEPKFVHCRSDNSDVLKKRRPSLEGASTFKTRGRACVRHSYARPTARPRFILLFLLFSFQLLLRLLYLLSPRRGNIVELS